MSGIAGFVGVISQDMVPLDLSTFLHGFTNSLAFYLPEGLESSGGKITGWQDSSGYGRNLYPNLASTQMNPHVDSVSGKIGARFNDLGDYLGYPGFILPSDGIAITGVFVYESFDTQESYLCDQGLNGTKHICMGRVAGSQRFTINSPVINSGDNWIVNIMTDYIPARLQIGAGVIDTSAQVQKVYFYDPSEESKFVSNQVPITVPALREPYISYEKIPFNKFTFGGQAKKENAAGRYHNGVGYFAALWGSSMTDTMITAIFARLATEFSI